MTPGLKGLKRYAPNAKWVGQMTSYVHDAETGRKFFNVRMFPIEFTTFKNIKAEISTLMEAGMLSFSTLVNWFTGVLFKPRRPQLPQFAFKFTYPWRQASPHFVEAFFLRTDIACLGFVFLYCRLQPIHTFASLPQLAILRSFCDRQRTESESQVFDPPRTTLLRVHETVRRDHVAIASKNSRA